MRDILPSKSEVTEWHKFTHWALITHSLCYSGTISSRSNFWSHCRQLVVWMCGQSWQLFMDICYVLGLWAAQPNTVRFLVLVDDNTDSQKYTSDQTTSRVDQCSLQDFEVTTDGHILNLHAPIFHPLCSIMAGQWGVLSCSHTVKIVSENLIVSFGKSVKKKLHVQYISE